MKSIEVVAAIIINEKKIFAVQRGYGQFKGWWEFPGGKVEKGENLQDALKREIKEELSSEIEISKLMKTIEYDYPDFHLKLHCFTCQLTAGSLTLSEHTNFKWLLPKDLFNVKWLPADLEIIKCLSQL